MFSECEALLIWDHDKAEGYLGHSGSPGPARPSLELLAPGQDARHSCPRLCCHIQSLGGVGSDQIMPLILIQLQIISSCAGPNWGQIVLGCLVAECLSPWGMWDVRRAS